MADQSLFKIVRSKQFFFRRRSFSEKCTRGKIGNILLTSTSLLRRTFKLVKRCSCGVRRCILGREGRLGERWPRSVWCPKAKWPGSSGAGGGGVPGKLRHREKNLGAPRDNIAPPKIFRWLNF